MKATTLIMLVCAATMSLAAAEEQAKSDKSVVQKTKDVLKKAEEKTKDAGRAIANGTKKATRALVDAVTPDSDAKKIEVNIDDSGIHMPARLEAGKTAFVVKNAGKEKHNFHIKGEGVDEKFLLDVAAADTKVMHVQLKPGTYHITCPAHEKDKGMSHTLKVE